MMHLLLALALLQDQGAGLAAKYPGDVGLGADPAVLLFEDFEETPKTVDWMKPDGWFAGVKFGPGLGMEITDQVPAAGGKRCLQYNLKTKKQSSGGMFRLLKPSECVYVRYYRMFEKDWEWPKGYGPHDLALYGYLGNFKAPTSTEICAMVDFRQTADTMFGVGTPLQEPMKWDEFYKEKFGTKNPIVSTTMPWNKSKPDKIEPMKWHCVEIMIQLSAPGQRDGVMKLWVNGKLVSECDGMPLRDAKREELRINLMLVAPYFHPGSPKDQTHYTDQIVVATQYIGPIHPKGTK